MFKREEEESPIIDSSSFNEKGKLMQIPSLRTYEVIAAHSKYHLYYYNPKYFVEYL